jgi:hypothetical protein
MDIGHWGKADVIKNHDKASEPPLTHQLSLMG